MISIEARVHPKSVMAIHAPHKVLSMFHSRNVCLHRPGQALRVHHRSVVSGLLQTAAHPVGTRSGGCLDAAHSRGMGDGPLHTPGPGCSAVHMQQAAVWVPDRVCIRSSPPVSLHQHGICLATPSDHFRLPPQGALARPDVGPLFGHAESFQRATTPANGTSSLMSFPHGSRVNDGIDPSLCSLAYTTVDEVAALIAKLGPGALLAKVDIESAYRLIPVHPQDRPLQAMRWEGQLYIDPMLPFGLHSDPKIFNAVANALNWHLHQSEIPLIRHYMDDFIIIAPPHSSQCRE